MSPAGYNNIANVWFISSTDGIKEYPVNGTFQHRPVINLMATVTATKGHDNTLNVDVYEID